MFTLKKIFRFEASHVLVHHDGKCGRLHGHSWIGTVEVRGTELMPNGPKEGMLIDYADINAHVKPLVEFYLDHYHLNDTLHTDSPTSEFIAKWIFDKLYEALPGLSAVVINETCTSECRYEPQRQ